MALYFSNNPTFPAPRDRIQSTSALFAVDTSTREEMYGGFSQVASGCRGGRVWQMIKLRWIMLEEYLDQERKVYDVS